MYFENLATIQNITIAYTVQYNVERILPYKTFKLIDHTNRVITLKQIQGGSYNQRRNTRVTCNIYNRVY